MIGPAAVFTEKLICRVDGSTVFVGGGRRTVEWRRRQTSLNGASAGLHSGKVTDALGVDQTTPIPEEVSTQTLVS